MENMFLFDVNAVIMGHVLGGGDAMGKHYYVEIELNGCICAKRFCYEGVERPKEEDVRIHFRGLGYLVGNHVRFC